MNPIFLAMVYHWMHIFGARESACALCGGHDHKLSECPWRGKE